MDELFEIPMEIEFISQGGQGIIVKPPIGLNNQNYVGKISPKFSLYIEETIENEFNIIKMFPRGGPYNLDKVSLNILNKEELKKVKLLTDRFEDEEEDLYQLILPYVPGKNLDNFFNEDGLYMGSINSWIDQLQSLLNLRHSLKIFHDLDLYHNDIKSDNIIYNDDLKTMSLVDFGLSKHYPEYNGLEEDENCDLINIDRLIIDYLNGVINRSCIKEWIIESEISYIEDTEFIRNNDSHRSINFFMPKLRFRFHNFNMGNLTIEIFKKK